MICANLIRSTIALGNSLVTLYAIYSLKMQSGKYSDTWDAFQCRTRITRSTQWLFVLTVITLLALTLDQRLLTIDGLASGNWCGRDRDNWCCNPVDRSCSYVNIGRGNVGNEFRSPIIRILVLSKCKTKSQQQTEHTGRFHGLIQQASLSTA